MALKSAELYAKKLAIAYKSIVFAFKKNIYGIGAGFVFQDIAGEVVFVDYVVRSCIGFAAVKDLQAIAFIKPGYSIYSQLKIRWVEVFQSAYYAIVEDVEHSVIGIDNDISFHKEIIRTVRKKSFRCSIVEDTEISKIIHVSHDPITNFE